jgi:hypothetical protein
MAHFLGTKGFTLANKAPTLPFKSGAGTPAVTATVPDFAGQVYWDTAATKMYIAKAATAATDFIIVN